MGKVQNGFKYHVWGTSADPLTWYEQNCTLENAKLRQLNRRLVDHKFTDEDWGVRAPDADVDVDMSMVDADGDEESKDETDKYKYVIEGPREVIK